MKIVIANSIGVNENGNHIVHFPSRWTASVGKTKRFTYYPYELAYLSSLLKRELKKEIDCEIKMIDGNLLQLDAESYTNLLKKYQPDWLIMEPSTLTYKEDLRVAKSLKREFGTKIIFTGPHVTAFSKETLSDGVDCVCIGEYEYTVLDILSGKKPKDILGLYPNSRRPLIDINKLPFPEDEDISRFDYAQPGETACEYKEIEMFPSRGCPMKCTFCVASNLYYAQPGWRSRNIDNIIKEINYLKNKYPQMEGIFFDEEYHNANKEFIKNLTKAIKKNGLDDLKYNAMCGYWTLDEETIKAMYDAGYYKLRVGIETASKITAKGIKKPINIARLKSVLKIAKSVGMKMYGTFTFGAPGSTKEEDKKTIKLIKELIDKNLLYDLQISICTPQPGTPFYNWVSKNKYLINTDWEDYDGVSCAVVSYPNYSKKEIEKMFSLAQRIYVNACQNRDIRHFGIRKYLQKTIKQKSNQKIFCVFYKGLLKIIKKIKREIELKKILK